MNSRQRAKQRLQTHSPVVFFAIVLLLYMVFHVVSRSGVLLSQRSTPDDSVDVTSARVYKSPWPFGLATSPCLESLSRQRGHGGLSP